MSQCVMLRSARENCLWEVLHYSIFPMHFLLTEDNCVLLNILNSLQNLDLTKHRLIYDGPLTMKLGDTKRFKTIDLHVLLLEDCIMLLQKQDDKYLLKFHTSTFGTTAVGTQGHKFCHSPVIKFATMLVRPVATGKIQLHPKYINYKFWF